MKTLAIVAVTLATIAGCASDSGDDEDCAGGKCDEDALPACPASDGLIGAGTAAPGQFPATVGLLVDNDLVGEPNFLTCTMTKIGPRAYLIAAHCMFEGGHQTGDTPIRPQLVVGAEIGLLFGVFQAHQQLPEGHPPSVVTRAKVVETRIHPTWLKPVQEGQTMDGKLLASDADVAILVVDIENPDVGTARIETGMVERCTPVVMQGYGCDSFPEFGFANTTELRSLDANIELVIDTLLYISSGFTNSPETGGICPGDSGGALYAGDPADNLHIVGINSRFVSGALLGSQIGPNESYFTRLDDSGPVKVASWLHEQMVALGQ
jgi:hypothetical protein